MPSLPCPRTMMGGISRGLSIVLTFPDNAERLVAQIQARLERNCDQAGKKTIHVPMIATPIPPSTRRIDSWAAGLSGAAQALCVQIQRADSGIVQALETFEERQRALFDQLFDQVLGQQPASVQAFLCQTAVLRRFSADLCDTVLAVEHEPLKAQHDSAQPARAQFTLEGLAHANLFIIPLEGEGHWYRYYHRFADFLKAKLSQAEQQTIHRKASTWFEAQGLLPEALEHALAAKDLEAANRLIAHTADTPVRLRLQLFGRFELRLDGQPISQLYSNKVQALLIYLALQSHRAASRETLQALLWGEYPRQQAQASLRNTLSKLKHILGAAANQTAGRGEHVSPAPLLLVTRQAVQLMLDPAHDWIDVLVFDDLLAQCRAHAHGSLDDCALCLGRLIQAVALYRADVLSGWTVPDSPAFDEWRLLEQEQRQRQVLVALDTLISHYAALGNFDQVQQYARQQLAFEPWHEQAHWQLIRALAARGERAAALAQYESYRAILWTELAAEPDPAIQRLADQIRTTAPREQCAGIADTDVPTPPRPRTNRVGRF